MKMKYAIFDMDGTLIDSMWIWDRAASNFLKAHGITPPEDVDSTFKTFTILGACHYLKANFGVEGSDEEIVERINKMASDGYDLVEAKPGVGEFLTYLAEKGVPMAVASSTDKALIEKTLTRLGLRAFFSHIVSSSDVGVGKSSPKVFDEALSRLGGTKEECIVFEDSLFAMMTAKTAGYTVAAVRDNGMENKWEESSAYADYAIESYESFDKERLFR